MNHTFYRIKGAEEVTFAVDKEYVVMKYNMNIIITK